MNLVTTNDLLDDIFIKEFPAATIVELKYDPIACACASYRAWKTSGVKFADLDKVIPTTEDLIRAQAIRNYYRAKITWQMLQSRAQHPVSEFRRKLMGIIEGTQRITTTELGILHRINYFYDEDLAHDAIFESFYAKHNQVGLLTEMFADRRSRVSLDRTVLVSRRKYENVEFWLEPTDGSAPCVITVAQQNPLLSLVSSMFCAGPVELISNWYPRIMPGPGDRAYYRLVNPKLA